MGICLGRALDEALGDRAGISRYGHAVVPMDEARAACAIDLSGRGLCVFEADLAPGAIGNFDHELVEEFFRALALNARLTLHLTHRARRQRPPHDRGRVQGRGPGPAGRHRDRPGQAGVPSTKGTLT